LTRHARPTYREHAAFASTKKQTPTTTAGRQRRIQRSQVAHDQRSLPPDDEGKKKPGVQAGARREPDKLPPQHIAKPGHEAAVMRRLPAMNHSGVWPLQISGRSPTAALRFPRRCARSAAS